MDSADDRVLIFEEGGYVYVFDDLLAASGFAESIDVVDGWYVGAFQGDGRVIRILATDDVYADLELTDEYDLPGLNALVQGCRFPPYRQGENVAEFTDRYLEAERRPGEPWSLGRLWARVNGRA